MGRTTPPLCKKKSGLKCQKKIWALKKAPKSRFRAPFFEKLGTRCTKFFIISGMKILVPGGLTPPPPGLKEVVWTAPAKHRSLNVRGFPNPTFKKNGENLNSKLEKKTLLNFDDQYTTPTGGLEEKHVLRIGAKPGRTFLGVLWKKLHFS